MEDSKIKAYTLITTFNQSWDNTDRRLQRLLPLQTVLLYRRFLVNKYTKGKKEKASRCLSPATYV
jgi:hypothetical protein